MIHWSFLFAVAVWSYLLGEKRGWRDSHKLTLAWRRQSRDWRYAFELAVAKNQEELNEVTAAYSADIAEIQAEQEAA